MVSTKLDAMKTGTAQTEAPDTLGGTGSLWYDGGAHVVDKVGLRADELEILADKGGVCVDEVGVHVREFAVSCTGGTSDCFLPELVIPEPSSRGCDVSRAYDDIAREATRRINLILKEAAKSRKDADLMLCNVGGGQMMLLWGTKELPEGFTPVRDIREIRRHLGVKPVNRAELWSGSQETTAGQPY